MERRDFIKTSATAAFAASMGFGCAPGMPDSRKLVATPEDRAKYLDKILNELCIEIGPRPYSSPAYLKGADAIMREMKLAMTDVTFDEFTVDRWKLNGEQTMTIDGNPVTAYVYMESPGTLPEGITGILKKTGDDGTVFELVSDKNETLAYIYVQGSPHARPQYYGPRLAENLKNLPAIGVGKDDQETFIKAAESKAKVVFTAQTEWEKGVQSHNVVGVLPGENADEIVMLGHLDSMYTAPGANDNGATLIVMLMWAHALSGKKPPKTLVFIAPDGEECGMKGAYKYVEKRKADGSFDRIKYVFNYDSFTWGPDIVLYGRDQELISTYGAVKDELKVGGELQVTDHDGFWLDAEPFKSDNVRGMSVSTGGLDVATGGSSVFDKCWHQPADLPENVNKEWAENHYQIFMKFLEKIMAL